MSGVWLDLALSLVLVQGSPRDPSEILSSLGMDLRKALRPNVNRLALQKAAMEEFEKDLARAAVRLPKPIWDHFNEYLGRLHEAERSFNAADQKPERELWIAGCRTALLKVATLTRVPEEIPSTAELFNECVDAVGRVRSRITGEGIDDLRTSAYESINHIFRAQLRRCRVGKGDPKAVYASQVALIDLRFGKGSDLPERMLRDIARACLDKDVAARR